MSDDYPTKEDNKSEKAKFENTIFIFLFKYIVYFFLQLHSTCHYCGLLKLVVTIELDLYFDQMLISL